MILNSPGYKSQLIFTAFDGKSEDRGDHVAIHTLSNPNFFWGNLLIFNRPPKKGDFSAWSDTFRKEFTNPRASTSQFTAREADVEFHHTYLVGRTDFEIKGSSE